MVMDCAVEPPGCHTFPVAVLLVSTTESPVQKVTGPLAEITGVAGKGLTVITTSEEVALHPFTVVVTL
jgi:hypothetical protein